MYFIVGGIIAVILLLIIGVFYVQMQDTKKRVAKQKALMEQSRLIQDDFKQQAQILIDATIINSQQKQKFCYLANNFFVFQPVNDVGVTNLQKLTDYFSAIVVQATTLEVTETLIEVFAMTANRVPSSARDFTSSFYMSNATKILTQLSNDVESIINGDFEEPEEAEETAKSTDKTKIDESTSDESDNSTDESNSNDEQEKNKEAI